VTGVVLVDKPLELSSNAALQQVRRRYRARKAGHAGTLDPLATGLLVVCFGEATKFTSYLLESHKHYEGTLRLGARTATGDVEGEVVETSPLPAVMGDLGPVEHAFTGTIRQRPPAYSALKQDGQPLYRLARKGIEVDAPEREVVIQRLTLSWRAPDLIAFDVECGSGTYIRSLGEDIARALGTAGHLASLRRTGSGPFRIDEAATPVVLAGLDEAAALARLLSPAVLPYRLPLLTLPDEAARDIVHGRRTGINPRTPPGRYRLFDPANGFLGIGDVEPGGSVAPVRLMSGPFPTPQAGREPG
jgi:tRNA pseudouridine55 synthase